MPQNPTGPRSLRQSREGNPNWRGGRSIASNGYVLVRVGIGHPLADVRGYAYEHRLVASQKIGRWVQPHEHVHHKDEDKQNNDPSNLQVVPGSAEHRFLHRKKQSGRRLPGEPNPDIECACGCGVVLPKFDEGGRPRTFVSGHNPHEAPAASEVIELLSRLGPLRVKQLIALTGRSKSSIRLLVSKLAARGSIRRVSRGFYETIPSN